MRAVGRLFAATVSTDRFPDPFHVRFTHRRPSFQAWVTLAKRSSTLSASLNPWTIWLRNSAHSAPVANENSAQPSRKEERVSGRRAIQRRIRTSWTVGCARRPHCKSHMLSMLHDSGKGWESGKASRKNGIRRPERVAVLASGLEKLFACCLERKRRSFCTIEKIKLPRLANLLPSDCL